MTRMLVMMQKMKNVMWAGLPHRASAIRNPVNTCRHPGTLAHQVMHVKPKTRTEQYCTPQWCCCCGMQRDTWAGSRQAQHVLVL